MKKSLPALALLLSGCASIINGTSENIDIHSEEKGAAIYLNDERIGTGSASVKIPKSRLSSSLIRVSKPGCDDAVKSVQTTFDSAALLGIFWDFGIVSIFVVDWAMTGATQKAERTSYLLAPVC